MPLPALTTVGISIILKDDNVTIYAGRHGTSWADVCEIKTLWIAEAARGNGLGACLLASGEREARLRGCHTIRLASFSFQAPGFQEKHGFVAFARLDNLPRAHANVFLVKNLATD